MRSISFSKPVSIFVGLGFPRAVDDVLEAYTLLNEWPQASRCPAHLVALHTCAAVLGGRGSATDARGAFEAFATDRGILAPEALQRGANQLRRELWPRSDSMGRLPRSTS
jgi:hypothetical protein